MNLLPCVVLALAPAADAHEANPLYQELRTKGVAVSAQATLPLPAPYLPDGLKPDEQKAILEKLCVGPDPKKPLFRYEDVIERTAAAPRFLEQTQIKPSDPDAPAWANDLWFVAYGDLKALSKRDPQQLFASSPQGATSTILDEDELAERKITLDLKPPLRERIVNVEADLIDTVHISSTNDVVGSQTGESILVASKIDPRFVKDPKYPNYWQVLSQKGGGPGPKRSLEVGAGYLKITRLAAPKDALLVEFHQIAAEPKEWFNGAPVLRGKIPLWVDQEVKNFRISSLKTLPKP